MDQKERNELLIRLDTNMDNIIRRLDEMPCEKREKRIGQLEVRQGKTETRLETHNKFIFSAILTSISSVIGLIFLGVKMLLTNAFVVK